MNSKDLLQLYNGQLQEFELAKKNYTDLQQAVYRDIPFDLFRLRIPVSYTHLTLPTIA